MQAGDHGRSVVGALAKQPQRVKLVLRVEVIGRLVKQVYVGLLSQHLRDREPAPFSSRQREYVATRQAGEVDSRECGAPDGKIQG